VPSGCSPCRRGLRGSDRAAKWRASDKGRQLQEALKKTTPLSKGHIGMLLLAVWRSSSSCGRQEKRGGKKGVRSEKDKDH